MVFYDFYWLISLRSFARIASESVWEMIVFLRILFLFNANYDFGDPPLLGINFEERFLGDLFMGDDLGDLSNDLLD